MFADISGFTNLSEACEKKGSRGNEELAFCINRYMEGMVSNLNQYGGDIIKFVGDAMIVMWPPINRELPNWQETRDDSIRRAIQCSQDIQKHMNNLQILPGATLSVKVSNASAFESSDGISSYNFFFRRSASGTVSVHFCTSAVCLAAPNPSPSARP